MKNTTKAKTWWNISPFLFVYSFSASLQYMGLFGFLFFQYFSLKEWSPAGRKPLQTVQTLALQALLAAQHS